MRAPRVCCPPACVRACGLACSCLQHPCAHERALLLWVSLCKRGPVQARMGPCPPLRLGLHAWRDACSTPYMHACVHTTSTRREGAAHHPLPRLPHALARFPTLYLFRYFNMRTEQFKELRQELGQTSRCAHACTKQPAVRQQQPPGTARDLSARTQAPNSAAHAHTGS